MSRRVAVPIPNPVSSEPGVRQQIEKIDGNARMKLFYVELFGFGGQKKTGKYPDKNAPTTDMFEKNFFDEAAKRRGVKRKYFFGDIETIEAKDFEKIIENNDLAEDQKELYRNTFNFVGDKIGNQVKEKIFTFFSCLEILSASSFISFAASFVVEQDWVLSVESLTKDDLRFEKNTYLQGHIFLYLIGILVTDKYIESLRKVKEELTEKTKEPLQFYNHLMKLRKYAMTHREERNEAIDQTGKCFANVSFVLIPAIFRLLLREENTSMDCRLPYVLGCMMEYIEACNELKLTWMIPNQDSIFLKEAGNSVKYSCKSCFEKINLADSSTTARLSLGNYVKPDEEMKHICPTEIINSYVCGTVEEWNLAEYIGHNCENQKETTKEKTFYRSAYPVYLPRFVCVTFETKGVSLKWDEIVMDDIPVGPSLIGSYGKYRVVSFFNEECVFVSEEPDRNKSGTVWFVSVGVKTEKYKQIGDSPEVKIQSLQRAGIFQLFEKEASRFQTNTPFNIKSGTKNTQSSVKQILFERTE